MVKVYSHSAFCFNCKTQSKHLCCANPCYSMNWLTSQMFCSLALWSPAKMEQCYIKKQTDGNHTESMQTVCSATKRNVTASAVQKIVSQEKDIKKKMKTAKQMQHKTQDTKRPSLAFKGLLKNNAVWTVSGKLWNHGRLSYYETFVVFSCTIQ